MTRCFSFSSLFLMVSATLIWPLFVEPVDAQDGLAGSQIEKKLVLYHSRMAFITDIFDPETGATGKTHDWRVTRRLVEADEAFELVKAK